ncbi:unnamed protein product, partial [Sphenostylis stenocarpa]
KRNGLGGLWRKWIGSQWAEGVAMVGKLGLATKLGVRWRWSRVWLVVDRGNERGEVGLGTTMG